MKKIQILGTGCPRCNMLAKHAEEAAKSIGSEYEIEKVTKIDEIMAFGVMVTPALVIDGQVKVVGKVPSIDEITRLLE